MRMGDFAFIGTFTHIKTFNGEQTSRCVDLLLHTIGKHAIIFSLHKSKQRKKATKTKRCRLVTSSFSDRCTSHVSLLGWVKSSATLWRWIHALRFTRRCLVVPRRGTRKRRWGVCRLPVCGLAICAGGLGKSRGVVLVGLRVHRGCGRVLVLYSRGGCRFALSPVPLSLLVHHERTGDTAAPTTAKENPVSKTSGAVLTQFVCCSGAVRIRFDALARFVLRRRSERVREIATRERTRVRKGRGRVHMA